MGEATRVEVKNGEASIKGLIWGSILADAPELTNYTMQCMVKGIEGFLPDWQFNIYVRVQPASKGKYLLGVQPEEGLMLFSPAQVKQLSKEGISDACLASSENRRRRKSDSILC